MASIESEPRRLLSVRVTDSAGAAVQAEWPVSATQMDSHADAVSVGLNLYETLNGADNPTPRRVEIETEFVER